MRQEKKGEIYSSVIKYILMAFFSLVVLVAGFKGVTFIRDRACNAELANFEIELSGIDKELRFGAKEQKDFRIPCKTSQIYFFDLGKKINPNDFNSLPLIKNAIATNSSKNVFIVDRGKVKKSFYAGNIEAIYPYYMCLKPKFDRVSFFAEGKGQSALLTGACGQPDCTLIPINITETEAQRIIQEAVYSQLGCDKCKYDYALENIKSTKQKVELFRRFIICNGITKVEIMIRPEKGAKVENFRYYEYIPKECIDDLSSYIRELELEDNVIVQENDPLIVWHFDEIEEETVLSYELAKEFGESCKKIIEGLGVMQTIQGAVPPPPFCGDGACNGLETCSTCPDDCVCLVQPQQPAIPPAAQPAPAPTLPAQCQGGIPLGCDPVIQPRKCVALGNNQYEFVNACLECGCPSGWNCEGNGNCGAPATSNQCSDGTLRGDCSNTKPLECRSNLVLSPNAGRCGCPSGERREDDDCVPDVQAQPNQPQPSPAPCTPPGSLVCHAGYQIKYYSPCENKDEPRFDCNDITCLGYDNLYDKECRTNNGAVECCCVGTWTGIPWKCYPPGETGQRQTGEDEDKEARLSASGSITNTQSASNENTRYNWQATITESNGVGVSITSFRSCLNAGCQNFNLNFNVPAGGSVTRTNFVETKAPNTFRGTYSGTDDNRNPKSVEFTIEIN
ncbi:hypothetical protein HYX06_06020 [Candidatus Woesearchaeota archaeon]|nr:hypothetical protein [Candidatus Woesearchaeota archaeon]